MAHAILSPSGAARWSSCSGAPAMERGIASTSSSYAAEGTAAHFLAAECLQNQTNPADYLGKHVRVGEDETAFADEGVKIDDEMVRHITSYVSFVREQAYAGLLFVEEELPIDHITGEEGATGTGDAVVLSGTTLKIIDLKYGRGKLVEAEDNLQLILYGLGALLKFGLTADIEEVWMYIHQPRVASEPSLFVLPVARMESWASHLTERAKMALAHFQAPEMPPIHALSPGDNQCQWCKAKAKCPALDRFVQNAVEADFESLVASGEIALPELSGEALALKMKACDLVEVWLLAVRVQVESELFSGNPVPGWKLVEGRRGARKWLDEEEAEKALKAMRLKRGEMYEAKLITPTTAEKVLKDSPRRWSAIQKLISRAEGKPSVAPEHDKRPALKLDCADDFSTL